MTFVYSTPRMKTTAIFLCNIVLTYTLDCSQSPGFVPVSSSIELSNQLPTPIQAIVPSLQFKCPSFITGGNIRAVGASNFDVQVWRPQDNKGTFYNLVWRREFRRRSTRLSSVDAFVNSSFSMSPGIPVRSGDVVGFYSLEPARLLYTSSPQSEIIYTGASQGPLCNFSLNDTSVQRRASAVPLISLTYVSATNRDIQAAEQRLPSIGNSCTVTTLLTTTASDNVSTKSMPTAFESTIRDGNNQQTTTLPVVSDGISGSPVKEESSGDDGQFLSLSLLEFILVVVIAAVVVIAVFVVISVACCWCLHMKRVQMANKNCEVKRDERHIIMNVNPAYQAVMTSQTLTQTGQAIAAHDQRKVTTSACQIQQPPCLPTCAGNEQHQLPLASSHYQAATKTGVESTRKSFDNSNSVHHYSSYSPGNDDYSYPSLRVESFQDHHGYIIIQPELCVGESATPNVENHGSSSVMDHML